MAVYPNAFRRGYAVAKLAIQTGRVVKNSVTKLPGSVVTTARGIKPSVQGFFDGIVTAVHMRNTDFPATENKETSK